MRGILSALAFVTLVTTAQAQFRGPDASAQTITVQEVESARLGRNVTLVGNIVEHQREEYYTFRDETGDIRVEIDRHVWQRREVTPETRVQITGEVDRGPRGRYIDVEELVILK